MITTTRMSYYQQPEAALILLLMRHLQEHKGCVCCRGVWMDDSCTDQHLVRSGTGRAGPSQAEPSQVRFLSKKLISQADCWRASQKQSHRHREEESARFSSADCCERLLQAADVVTAASRSDDLMEPNTHSSSCRWRYRTETESGLLGSSSGEQEHRSFINSNNVFILLCSRSDIQSFIFDFFKISNIILRNNIEG